MTDPDPWASIAPLPNYNGKGIVLQGRKIYQDLARLRQAAAALRTYAAAIEPVSSDCDKIVREMLGGWKGKSSEAFMWDWSTRFTGNFSDYPAALMYTGHTHADPALPTLYAQVVNAADGVETMAKRLEDYLIARLESAAVEFDIGLLTLAAGVITIELGGIGAVATGAAGFALESVITAGWFAAGDAAAQLANMAIMNPVLESQGDDPIGFNWAEFGLAVAAGFATGAAGWGAGQLLKGSMPYWNPVLRQVTTRMLGAGLGVIGDGVLQLGRPLIDPQNYHWLQFDTGELANGALLGALMGGRVHDLFASRPTITIDAPGYERMYTTPRDENVFGLGKDGTGIDPAAKGLRPIDLLDKGVTLDNKPILDLRDPRTGDVIGNIRLDSSNPDNPRLIVETVHSTVDDLPLNGTKIQTHGTSTVSDPTDGPAGKPMRYQKSIAFDVSDGKLVPRSQVEVSNGNRTDTSLVNEHGIPVLQESQERLITDRHVKLSTGKPLDPRSGELVDPRSGKTIDLPGYAKFPKGSQWALNADGQVVAAVRPAETPPPGLDSVPRGSSDLFTAQDGRLDQLGRVTKPPGSRTFDFQDMIRGRETPVLPGGSAGKTVVSDGMQRFSFNPKSGKTELAFPAPVERLTALASGAETGRTSNDGPPPLASGVDTGQTPNDGPPRMPGRNYQERPPSIKVTEFRRLSPVTPSADRAAPVARNPLWSERAPSTDGSSALKPAIEVSAEAVKEGAVATHEAGAAVGKEPVPLSEYVRKSVPPRLPVKEGDDPILLSERRPPLSVADPQEPIKAEPVADLQEPIKAGPVTVPVIGSPPPTKVPVLPTRVPQSPGPPVNAPVKPPGPARIVPTADSTASSDPVDGPAVSSKPPVEPASKPSTRSATVSSPLTASSRQDPRSPDRPQSPLRVTPQVTPPSTHEFVDPVKTEVTPATGDRLPRPVGPFATPPVTDITRPVGPEVVPPYGSHAPADPDQAPGPPQAPVPDRPVAPLTPGRTAPPVIPPSAPSATPTSPGPPQITPLGPPAPGQGARPGPVPEIAPPATRHLPDSLPSMVPPPVFTPPLVPSTTHFPAPIPAELPHSVPEVALPGHRPGPDQVPPAGGGAEEWAREILRTFRLDERWLDWFQTFYGTDFTPDGFARFIADLLATRGRLDLVSREMLLHFVRRAVQATPGTAEADQIMLKLRELSALAAATTAPGTDVRLDPGAPSTGGQSGPSRAAIIRQLAPDMQVWAERLAQDFADVADPEVRRWIAEIQEAAKNMGVRPVDAWRQLNQVLGRLVAKQKAAGEDASSQSMTSDGDQVHPGPVFDAPGGSGAGEPAPESASGAAVPEIWKPMSPETTLVYPYAGLVFSDFESMAGAAKPGKKPSAEELVPGLVAELFVAGSNISVVEKEIKSLLPWLVNYTKTFNRELVVAARPEATGIRILVSRSTIGENSSKIDISGFVKGYDEPIPVLHTHPVRSWAEASYGDHSSIDPKRQPYSFVLGPKKANSAVFMIVRFDPALRPEKDVRILPKKTYKPVPLAEFQLGNQMKKTLREGMLKAAEEAGQRVTSLPGGPPQKGLDRVQDLVGAIAFLGNAEGGEPSLSPASSEGGAFQSVLYQALDLAGKPGSMSVEAGGDLERAYIRYARGEAFAPDIERLVAFRDLLIQEYRKLWPRLPADKRPGAPALAELPQYIARLEDVASLSKKHPGRTNPYFDAPGDADPRRLPEGTLKDVRRVMNRARAGVASAAEIEALAAELAFSALQSAQAHPVSWLQGLAGDFRALARAVAAGDRTLVKNRVADMEGVLKGVTGGSSEPPAVSAGKSAGSGSAKALEQLGVPADQIAKLLGIHAAKSETALNAVVHLLGTVKAKQLGIPDESFVAFLVKGSFLGVDDFARLDAAVAALPSNVAGGEKLVGGILSKSSSMAVFEQRLAELTEVTAVATANPGRIIYGSVELGDRKNKLVTGLVQEFSLDPWVKAGAELDIAYASRDGKLNVAEIKHLTRGLDHSNSVAQVSRLMEWLKVDPAGRRAFVRIASDEKWWYLASNFKMSDKESYPGARKMLGDRDGVRLITLLAEAGVHLVVGGFEFTPQKVAALNEAFAARQIDLKNPPSIAEVANNLRPRSDGSYRYDPHPGRNRPPDIRAQAFDAQSQRLPARTIARAPDLLDRVRDNRTSPGEVEADATELTEVRANIAKIITGGGPADVRDLVTHPVHAVHAVNPASAGLIEAKVLAADLLAKVEQKDGLPDGYAEALEKIIDALRSSGEAGTGSVAAALENVYRRLVAALDRQGLPTEEGWREDRDVLERSLRVIVHALRSSAEEPRQDFRAQDGLGDEWKPASEYQKSVPAQHHELSDVQLFTDTDEAVKYGQLTWSEVIKLLASEEYAEHRAALQGYTDETIAGSMGPPSYQAINRFLKGTLPKSAAITGTIPGIVKSINYIDGVMALQSVTRKILVSRTTSVRAFPVEQLEDLPKLEGVVIHVKNYLSTHLSVFEETEGVVLHLIVPEGTPAVYLEEISYNSTEHELLLSRGLDLVIDKVRHGEGWHIDAHIVLPAEGFVPDEITYDEHRHEDVPAPTRVEPERVEQPTDQSAGAEPPRADADHPKTVLDFLLGIVRGAFGGRSGGTENRQATKPALDAQTLGALSGDPQTGTGKPAGTAFGDDTTGVLKSANAPVVNSPVILPGEEDGGVRSERLRLVYRALEEWSHSGYVTLGFLHRKRLKDYADALIRESEEIGYESLAREMRAIGSDLQHMIARGEDGDPSFVWPAKSGDPFIALWRLGFMVLGEIGNHNRRVLFESPLEEMGIPALSDREAQRYLGFYNRLNSIRIIEVGLAITRDYAAPWGEPVWYVTGIRGGTNQIPNPNETKVNPRESAPTGFSWAHNHPSLVDSEEELRVPSGESGDLGHLGGSPYMWSSIFPSDGSNDIIKYDRSGQPEVVARLQIPQLLEPVEEAIAVVDRQRRIWAALHALMTLLDVGGAGGQGPDRLGLAAIHAELEVISDGDISILEDQVFEENAADFAGAARQAVHRLQSGDAGAGDIAPLKTFLKYLRFAYKERSRSAGRAELLLRSFFSPRIGLGSKAGARPPSPEGPTDDRDGSPSDDPLPGISRKPSLKMTDTPMTRLGHENGSDVMSSFSPSAAERTGDVNVPRRDFEPVHTVARPRSNSGGARQEFDRLPSALIEKANGLLEHVLNGEQLSGELHEFADELDRLFRAIEPARADPHRPIQILADDFTALSGPGPGDLRDLAMVVAEKIGLASSEDGRDDGGRAALEEVVRAQFALENELDELKARGEALEETQRGDQEAIDERAAVEKDRLDRRIAEENRRAEAIRTGNVARARLEEQRIKDDHAAAMAKIDAEFAAKTAQIEKEARLQAAAPIEEEPRLQAATQAQAIEDDRAVEAADFVAIQQGRQASHQNDLDQITAEYEAELQRIEAEFVAALPPGVSRADVLIPGAVQNARPAAVDDEPAASAVPVTPVVEGPAAPPTPARTAPSPQAQTMPRPMTRPPAAGPGAAPSSQGTAPNGPDATRAARTALLAALARVAPDALELRDGGLRLTGATGRQVVVSGGAVARALAALATRVADGATHERLTDEAAGWLNAEVARSGRPRRAGAVTDDVTRPAAAAAGGTAPDESLRPETLLRWSAEVVERIEGLSAAQPAPAQAPGPMPSVAVAGPSGGTSIAAVPPAGTGDAGLAALRSALTELLPADFGRDVIGWSWSADGSTLLVETRLGGVHRLRPVLGGSPVRRDRAAGADPRLHRFTVATRTLAPAATRGSSPEARARATRALSRVWLREVTRVLERIRAAEARSGLGAVGGVLDAVRSTATREEAAAVLFTTHRHLERTWLAATGADERSVAAAEIEQVAADLTALGRTPPVPPWDRALAVPAPVPAVPETPASVLTVRVREITDALRGDVGALAQRIAAYEANAAEAGVRAAQAQETSVEEGQKRDGRAAERSRKAVAANRAALEEQQRYQANADAYRKAQEQAAEARISYLALLDVLERISAAPQAAPAELAEARLIADQAGELLGVYRAVLAAALPSAAVLPTAVVTGHMPYLTALTETINSLVGPEQAFTPDALERRLYAEFRKLVSPDGAVLSLDDGKGGELSIGLTAEHWVEVLDSLVSASETIVGTLPQGGQQTAGTAAHSLGVSASLNLLKLLQLVFHNPIVDQVASVVEVDGQAGHSRRSSETGSVQRVGLPAPIVDDRGAHGLYTARQVAWEVRFRPLGQTEWSRTEHVTAPAADDVSSMDFWLSRAYTAPPPRDTVQPPPPERQKVPFPEHAVLAMTGPEDMLARTVDMLRTEGVELDQVAHAQLRSAFTEELPGKLYATVNSPYGLLVPVVSGGRTVAVLRIRTTPDPDSADLVGAPNTQRWLERVRVGLTATGGAESITTASSGGGSVAGKLPAFGLQAPLAGDVQFGVGGSGAYEVSRTYGMNVGDATYTVVVHRFTGHGQTFGITLTHAVDLQVFGKEPRGFHQQGHALMQAPEAELYRYGLPVSAAAIERDPSGAAARNPDGSTRLRDDPSPAPPPGRRAEVPEFVGDRDGRMRGAGPALVQDITGITENADKVLAELAKRGIVPRLDGDGLPVWSSTGGRTAKAGQLIALRTVLDVLDWRWLATHWDVAAQNGLTIDLMRFPAGRAAEHYGLHVQVVQHFPFTSVGTTTVNSRATLDIGSDTSAISGTRTTSWSAGGGPTPGYSGGEALGAAAGLTDGLARSRSEQWSEGDTVNGVTLEEPSGPMSVFDGAHTVEFTLVDGEGRRTPLGSFPGNARYSWAVDLLPPANPSQVQHGPTPPPAVPVLPSVTPAQTPSEVLERARLLHLDVGDAVDAVARELGVRPGTAAYQQLDALFDPRHLMARPEWSTGGAYGTDLIVDTKGSAPTKVSVWVRGKVRGSTPLSSIDGVDGIINLTLDSVGRGSTTSHGGRLGVSPGATAQWPVGGAGVGGGLSGSRTRSDAESHLTIFGIEDLKIGLDAKIVSGAVVDFEVFVRRNGQDVPLMTLPSRPLLYSLGEFDALALYGQGTLPLPLDLTADVVERLLTGALDLDRTTAVPLIGRYTADLRAAAATGTPVPALSAAHTPETLAEKLISVAGIADAPAVTDPEQRLDELQGRANNAIAMPEPVVLPKYLRGAVGSTVVDDVQLRAGGAPTTLLAAITGGFQQVTPGGTRLDPALAQSLREAFGGVRWHGRFGDMLQPWGISKRFLVKNGVLGAELVTVEVRATLGADARSVGSEAAKGIIKQRYYYEQWGKSAASAGAVGYQAGASGAAGGWNLKYSASTGRVVENAASITRQWTWMQRLSQFGGVGLVEQDLGVTIHITRRPLRGPGARAARKPAGTPRRGAPKSATIRLTGVVRRAVPAALIRPRPAPPVAAPDPRPVPIDGMKLFVEETDGRGSFDAMKEMFGGVLGNAARADIEHQLARQWSATDRNTAFPHMLGAEGHEITVHSGDRTSTAVVHVRLSDPQVKVRMDGEIGAIHRFHSIAGWSLSSGRLRPLTHAVEVDHPFGALSVPAGAQASDGVSDSGGNRDETSGFENGELVTVKFRATYDITVTRGKKQLQEATSGAAYITMFAKDLDALRARQEAGIQPGAAPARPGRPGRGPAWRIQWPSPERPSAPLTQAMLDARAKHVEVRIEVRVPGQRPHRYVARPDGTLRNGDGWADGGFAEAFATLPPSLVTLADENGVDLRWVFERSQVPGTLAGKVRAEIQNRHAQAQPGSPPSTPPVLPPSLPDPASTGAGPAYAVASNTVPKHSLAPSTRPDTPAEVAGYIRREAGEFADEARAQVADARRRGDIFPVEADEIEALIDEVARFAQKGAGPIPAGEVTAYAGVKWSLLEKLRALSTLGGTWTRPLADRVSGPTASRPMPASELPPIPPELRTVSLVPSEGPRGTDEVDRRPPTERPRPSP